MEREGFGISLKTFLAGNFLYDQNNNKIGVAVPVNDDWEHGTSIKECMIAKVSPGMFR
jgi:hypothetical protein